MQKSLLEYATPAQEGACREGSLTMPKEKASKPDANPKTLFNLLPNSEVEAYGFIRERLRALGWMVKNPSSGTGGQVWTQNQCFAHEEIKHALGLKRPENIVKLSEQYLWVIEAKASRKQLDKAIEEAVHYYAKPINENPSGKLKAVLATGIAGSEETSYLIRTKIRVEGDWHVVTINGQEATGLLSPTDVQFLLKSGGSDIHEFAPPQRVFLEAAEKINELLHTGGINKNDRAKTIAALLLSVVEDPSVLGIIVKKGIPHKRDHPVFWARISKDGHLKLKSRRLPASEMEPARKELDEIPLVLPALQNFVAHPYTVNVNIPMLCKTAPIDFDDPLLELLPEAYIESKHFTEDAVHHAMDDLAREMACCLIRHRKENSVGALDAKN
jgi:hypothetical protein